eukprot:m51a1_g3007 hypothetical protein (391) ;mRNA; f:829763-831070
MWGRGVAGAVVMAVYVPLVLAVTALFWARRGLHPIRHRFPAEAVLSAAYGAVYVVFICAHNIAEDRWPCALYLWIVHFVPPIYAVPLLVRLWKIYCLHAVQKLGALKTARGAQHDVEHLIHWSSNSVVVRVWVAVAAVHAVAPVVESSLLGQYQRPDSRGHYCVLWEDVGYWIPILTTYLVMTVIGLVLLYGVRERYLIRAELVSCFASWGVFAGGYFVLLLLRSFDRLNREFPVSFVMACWPASTFVIGVLMPLLNTYGILWDHQDLAYLTAGIGISEVLRNAGNRRRFKRFLVSCFSVNEVLFWEEVEAYRCTKDPARRIKSGKSVISLFLDPSAPWPVSGISQSVLSEIMRLTDAEFASPETGVAVFNKAQALVKSQLERDFFKKTN